MNIPEEISNKLTEEQKQKALAARTPEDLLALAKEAGYELTPDQLDEVAGGGIWIECPARDPNTCPSRCPAI